MQKWLKKLRGLLGFSAVGGAIGALFGLARFGVMMLTGGVGVSVDLLLNSVLVYGGFAAIASGGVGVLLATAGSRLRLQELSPLKAGICGALLGATAPVVLVLATWSGATAPVVFASLALRFGLLGGVLGGGLVAVAKRADRTLPTGSAEPLLLGEE
jgi:hypothetical protein